MRPAKASSLGSQLILHVYNEQVLSSLVLSKISIFVPGGPMQNVVSDCGNRVC